MGWCGWPAAGGAALPEVLNLRATDFVPNPDGTNQDNPAQITRYPKTSAWFSSAIRYPPEQTGGAWAQTTFMTPADTTAVNPYVTIVWTTQQVGTNFASFDVHMTANGDGTPLVGGGPGTPITDQSAGFNWCNMAAETQIPITGGGTFGPNQLINLNLYRAYNAEPDIFDWVYVLLVRVRFARA